MIIVLAMLSVLFAPFIRITEAAETEQIIKNLEIVQKSDEYFPGESIYIKGDWSIPDDTPGNQYKAGDTFSMTIPQGLEAGFSSVNLGGLATGKIVGDKLVFTFTDEIEGLANRKGGFQLRFEVKSPDEEGKSEVDIGSKDENGNVLITDKITVNKPEQGEVGPSDESFAKGKMSQKMDGLEWYVRINHNNSITGNQIKFEDRLGPDHRLKEGTIVVQEHITGPQDVTDITDRVEIVIDSDKKGFTIPKLELGNAPGGHKHYTIYYETQYTGDETEGKVQLENTAKVISEDQGVLYPDHSKDEGMVEGEFDLGVAGWGQGNKWVKFKMKKVDSVTKEPLAGAKFKLSHKIDENFTPIEFTTDKNGEYEYDGHINNGLYVLEELEAPKGYEKMEPQDLRIFWDPDGGDHQVFEFEVENTLEPISIKGEKEWFDENNEPIESQEDIAVSLYANGEKVRQQILPKGETAFEFKNLPQKDEDGKTIKYTVKEVEVAGYTTSIAG
ncbi:MAG: Cna B-type domain-containing protein, partial [Alkalibacterium sp.]|nr:Cna B-type domain-containing protein [Tetragenococcus koreensis]MDN6641544.1 Cna B-type domain-containing protein [Tetragenococcus sp.]MDN6730528.1 Cna B-type domain-containing protein [Alkalibacterium sp.]